jgi:hypothetical protein
MKKGMQALLCVLAMASAPFLAWAQADHQVDDKGYINIGSYTETAAKKRPAGSLYRGSGILTFTGKPPKPYIQHDMGGYELDPAPNEDRNKPYNKHDLSHTWEFIVTSPGMGTPPMTAEGRRMREEHVTDDDVPMKHKPSNDPELTCDPIGYPRILFRNSRPFEVFQLATTTLFHHEWHETWQKVWMDGRLLPKKPIDPAWIGYSVGKWVGDTLVVDTNGVDDRAWLDTSGLGHSLDAEFQTRWRRVDHNTLQMNLTIKDPAIYTETWEKESTLFEMYPNLEIDILPCVPAEELEYRNNTPTEVPDAGVKK